MAEQAYHKCTSWRIGFEIRGGQFYSAAENIIIQSPQTRNRNVHQAQTGNPSLASFIPTVVPEAEERRGYPLWSPNPTSGFPEEHTKHGVHIGDVGIITADGAFDYLFNVCKPADHPINSDGVPPGFTPLPEPDPSKVAIDIGFSARSFLMSRSMRGGLRSSNSQSNNEQVELDYSFSCQNTDGALLLLPEGTFRQDLKNLLLFRQYAAQYGESWYKYANGEQQGREASNGSIHLVTGFDKGNSWAVAAFSNVPLTHAHPHIDLELNGQKVHTEAGRSYYWDQQGPACLKYGPVAIESANQCIFLRSFCISLNMRLWGKIFGVVEVTKTTDAPFERISPGNASIPFQGGSPGFLGGLFGGPSSPSSDYSAYAQWLNTSRDRPEVMISSTFVPGESHHPGRVINNFLLNKRPDAMVAIGHNDQWAPNDIGGNFQVKHAPPGFYITVEDDTVFLDTIIKSQSLGATRPPFLDAFMGPSLPFKTSETRKNFFVDSRNEFPVGSHKVSSFERCLTDTYCQSPYARERRRKNLVQSMIYYMEKEPRREYLIVKIKNHDDGFTSLKMEHTHLLNGSGNIITLFDNSTRRFDNHGKGHEVDFLQEVLFTNKDFTLHNLSMIASVIDKLSSRHPSLMERNAWFVATVVNVAVSLYSPTAAGKLPLDLFDFVDNVPVSVNVAISMFQELKDTNEQVIRDRIKTVREHLVKVREAADTAREKAKRAVQEEDQAWDEAHRAKKVADLAMQNALQGRLAMSEAEQAKKEAHHAWELAKQAENKVDQARKEVREIVKEGVPLPRSLGQNEIQEEQGARQPVEQVHSEQEQVPHEAESAEREVQRKKDAEMARLQHLLAESSIQGSKPM